MVGGLEVGGGGMVGEGKKEDGRREAISAGGRRGGRLTFFWIRPPWVWIEDSG